LEDKKNKKSFVNLVSVANDEFEDSEVNTNLLSVSLGTNSLIEFWILGSACSYHICLNRQWFETFTSCNSSIVLMGNDAMCKAIGICTIKFRMFDKGALVVMKGQKIGNLYKLLRNLVTCGVKIFTSVELDIDDTVLWHMRFRHFCERDVFELYKWNLLKGVKS
jgi:hypothetical protein